MKLLAIDPGLAATGFALLDITGYGRWVFLAAHTVRTKAATPLAERLLDLDEGARRWGGVDAAVVECAATSKAFGKHGAVQINHLMLATGALLLSARLVARTVDAVPVTRWWPRDGRVMQSEAQVIGRVRAIIPELEKHSQHAATAASLGDWYSRHDGLRLLTRGAA